MKSSFIHASSPVCFARLGLTAANALAKEAEDFFAVGNINFFRIITSST